MASTLLQLVKLVFIPALDSIIRHNFYLDSKSWSFCHYFYPFPDFNSPDDRMLEVVGVVGVPQLGISYMIGGLQHHRFVDRIFHCFSIMEYFDTDRSVIQLHTQKVEKKLI